MELKLHYMAALKKVFKSDANRKMFTIIQLVKFTLHFKVLALQIPFMTRQICRVMEKHNRLYTLSTVITEVSHLCHKCNALMCNY